MNDVVAEQEGKHVKPDYIWWKWWNNGWLAQWKWIILARAWQKSIRNVVSKKGNWAGMQTWYVFWTVEGRIYLVLIWRMEVPKRLNILIAWTSWSMDRLPGDPSFRRHIWNVIASSWYIVFSHLFYICPTYSESYPLSLVSSSDSDSSSSESPLELETVPDYDRLSSKPPWSSVSSLSSNTSCITTAQAPELS